MLVKKALLVAVGAIGAIELDRWWSRQRERLRPNALAGAAFDRINVKLEEQRHRAESAPAE
jgi:hypothetical protein